MEKGTGQHPRRPAAAPLPYRAPPARGVSAVRLAAVVVDGLVWLGIALLASGVLVFASVIAVAEVRTPGKRVWAVTVWLIAVVCIGPAAVRAISLSVRLLIREPVRMVRAARSDADDEAWVQDMRTPRRGQPR